MYMQYLLKFTFMPSNIHLSPQEKQIVSYLADGEWHCMTPPDQSFFMKDDRARFSALKRKGYIFESKPCELHNHPSRLFMRRLVKPPEKKQRSEAEEME